LSKIVEQNSRGGGGGGGGDSIQLMVSLLIDLQA
ncbi:unnamed protein product, partial [Rotaria magnacalcarata]